MVQYKHVNFGREMHKNMKILLEVFLDKEGEGCKIYVVKRSENKTSIKGNKIQFVKRSENKTSIRERV